MPPHRGPSRNAATQVRDFTWGRRPNTDPSRRSKSDPADGGESLRGDADPGSTIETGRQRGWACGSGPKSGR
jgi:hypothetical protein